MNPMLPGVANASVVTHSELRPSEALNYLPPPSSQSVAGVGAAAVRPRYGFRAAGLNFLVLPRAGTEVVVPPPISTLPGAPPWLRGMINLRGNIVPVYDLGEYAGLPTAGEKKLMLLVFGQGEGAAALLINDAPQRLVFAAQKVALPALPERVQNIVLGASLLADELWLEFDHDRAFDLLAGHAAG